MTMITAIEIYYKYVYIVYYKRIKYRDEISLTKKRLDILYDWFDGTYW